MTQAGSFISTAKSLFQTKMGRQLIFMVGVSLSVAVGISLYMSIKEPVYKALDYQVNSKNINSIVDILEKSKINYKIDQQNGVVLVPAGDYDTARIKLSSSGVPKDDSYSYNFMEEQSALTNSQFLENARYLKALESDLAKTISGIEGITGAKVHIAIPQNNLFSDENRKPTASVFINIAPGYAGNKEKIRSVIQVIADSVPGLDPKDVSITDQYGHFLSDGMDQGSMFSAAQLNYQNSVQSYYEKRIESIIVPLLGENKVVVRVNADIDFTQSENAQEEYDPTKTAVLSEQSDNEQSGSAGAASGPPGSLSNTPPSEKSSQQAETASGSQSRTQSTKNYNVSKSVTYKKSNVSKIKSLSVAVVIDNESVLDPKTKKIVNKAIEKEKLDKITELVKTIIGYDPKRGDKVTVVNSVYNQIKEEIPDVRLHFWDQPWFWDLMKKLIGILFGFVFLIFIYRKIFSENNHHYEKSISSQGLIGDGSANQNSVQGMEDPNQDGMKHLKELAVNDPEKVAAIFKSWVRK